MLTQEVYGFWLLSFSLGLGNVDQSFYLSDVIRTYLVNLTFYDGIT